MKIGEFRAEMMRLVLAWQEAHFPGLPVVYENGPAPDEDRIGSPWLDVSVRWYGSTQMTVGELVKKRHSGALSLMVFHRQHEGVAPVDEILDHLEDEFSNLRVGSGQLRAAQRTTPTNLKGWHKQGLLVPLWLDR